ncbi:hypothetical protein ALC60_11084 [Trachymyrmex zeteki]|uniref:Uncharacterized protein n=1 Tax=Mycetomoellerius zeteki TaxID=64791 RepID=A0A151WPT1_9HYME|nr:hypothetical protein ALC60_11084 [Trachymyrmex zeteki]
MQPRPPAAGFVCSLVNRPSHGREKENTQSERERREANQQTRDLDAVMYLFPFFIAPENEIETRRFGRNRDHSTVIGRATPASSRLRSRRSRRATTSCFSASVFGVGIYSVEKPQNPGESCSAGWKLATEPMNRFFQRRPEGQLSFSSTRIAEKKHVEPYSMRESATRTVQRIKQHKNHSYVPGLAGTAVDILGKLLDCASPHFQIRMGLFRDFGESGNNSSKDI